MKGKDHARIAAYMVVIETAAGLGIAAMGDHWVGIGLSIGSLGGYYITPDADHHIKTYEEKRWDDMPVVGPYLQETWAGYGAKERHRGRSHWHIWGTASRIWYFGRRFAADLLLLIYVWAVLLGGGQLDGDMVRALAPLLPGGGFVISVFAGWAIQDSIHIESDRLWSWWRSKRGRRQRRRVVWTLLGFALLAGVRLYLYR